MMRPSKEANIVHLKKFRFVNGRWIKSQKMVQFPRERFDPSVYLAPREAGLNGLHGLQSRSEGEELLRIGGGETVSSISAPTGFLNILKASPASGRKSAPPSFISRTSSPCSSPKSGGGGPGGTDPPQDPPAGQPTPPLQQQVEPGG
ncbi:uncharacterized protein ACWYII_011880 isoform 2-T4 [Salvelinus alpinus]